MFIIDTMVHKAQLRRQLKEQMRQLPQEQRQESDRQLFSQLLGLSWLQQARTVFTYVSVGAEPDTRRLARWLVKQGKTLAVPLCLGKGVMEAHKVSSLEELAPAPFGLLEPAENTPLVLPSEIDLVVVPCLAANTAGHRLGYGGGYYDRYLQQVACPTICLCRSEMLQTSLPIEPHDHLVFAVVTEDKVFYSNPTEEHQPVNA